jgi:hypothetical protein
MKPRERGHKDILLNDGVPRELKEGSLVIEIFCRIALVPIVAVLAEESIRIAQNAE